MTQPDSLISFPCEFAIKVFGNKSEDFETAVITIIRKHCAELRENAFAYRPSKDGKYLAITITIQAESKEQLDTIYQELSANPNVLMVL
jgi:putative lipoic acid-binding regulatory protein